jgi:hypothetical protein
MEIIRTLIFLNGSTAPWGPRPTHFLRLHHHTFRHTTLSVAEGPARRRDLYSQETDIHAPGGIRTHNPSKRAAEDPRRRQRGHWDRLRIVIVSLKSKQSKPLFHMICQRHFYLLQYAHCISNHTSVSSYRSQFWLSDIHCAHRFTLVCYVLLMIISQESVNWVSWWPF